MRWTEPFFQKSCVGFQAHAIMAPFEQLSERRAPGNVEDMVWCPTMDLVAVTTADNQLMVYRLSWQRVWSFIPTDDDAKISALAWRPDGKVLAVGAADGSVRLLDVEQGNELFKHSAGGIGVQHLCWGSRTETPKAQPADSLSDAILGHSCLENYDLIADADFFADRAAHVLPGLPKGPVDGDDNHVSPADILTNKRNTSGLAGKSAAGGGGATGSSTVLAAYYSDARVSCFALGVFCVGTTSLHAELVAKGIDVRGRGDDAHGATTGAAVAVTMALSGDASTVHIVVRMDSGPTVVVRLDVPLLRERRIEIDRLSCECAHILGLVDYLGTTMDEMHSSWESILIELDAKLASFSTVDSEGNEHSEPKSLEHEFMALLVRGIPSVELESFLVRELASKLKALGTAVESSYTSVQKLALHHLNQAVQTLMFRLSDLLGLARWEDAYGVLGLSPAAVARCTTLLGSLALKSSELVRRIDASRANFRAFFRWLSIVVESLGDTAEKSADTPAQAASTDFNQVATFIQENFGHKNKTRNGGVSVERVGQYFDRKKLWSVQEHPQPRWQNLLTDLTLETPSDLPCGYIYNIVVEDGEGADGMSLVELEATLEGVADARAGLDWLLEQGYLVLNNDVVTAQGETMIQQKASDFSLFPDCADKSLVQIYDELAHEVSALLAHHNTASADSPRVLSSGDATMCTTSVITLSAGHNDDVLANCFAVQSIPSDGAPCDGVMVTVAGSSGEGCTMHFVKIHSVSHGGRASHVALATVEVTTAVVVRVVAYADTAVVVLLRNSEGGNILAVVTTEDLTFHDVPAERIDAVPTLSLAGEAEGVDCLLRVLEDMTSSSVFVSSTRNVASVLHENQKTVQLFDLAMEDDSEEESGDGEEESGDENADAGVSDDEQDDANDDTGEGEATS
eukprot:m.963321 g.963321  ORF g.963321 m.963321 type:complete len:914 (+) comp23894_c0_seq11:238-2979(+)